MQSICAARAATDREHSTFRRFHRSLLPEPVSRSQNMAIDPFRVHAEALTFSKRSASISKSMHRNVETCINAVGIGFLYAPMFHPAMKHAAQTRADLGIKTCFNLLGPMTNPANVKRQLVGVFSHEAAQNIADVFSHLETETAFVIHSHDGLDEISLQSPTAIFEVHKNKKTLQYEIESSSFSLPAVAHSEVRGGDAGTNATIAWKILRGENIPHRNYVIANSAFGLMAAGKANSIQHGVQLAEESIDSGNALKKLNELIAFTNR